MVINKNKKGSMVLVFAFVAIIIIIIATAFVDITRQSTVITEIEGIMDTSGTNALQDSVNKDSVRNEIIKINDNNKANSSTIITDTTMKRDIFNKFAKEVNNSIGKDSIIKSISLQEINIELVKDTWGAGSTSKNHIQIVLHSVAKVTIDSSMLFDGGDKISLNLYNARHNDSFTIENSSVKEDGSVELLVRSMTRLVYR